MTEGSYWRPTFLGLGKLQASSRLFRLSAESVLWQHTSFPYATRFLSSESFKSAVDNAMGSTALPKRAGLSTYTITGGQKYRRFCRLCAAAEYAEYRESYWHRSHNLPGVWACTAHLVFLIQSDVAVGVSGIEANKLPHECLGSPLGEDGAMTRGVLAIANLSQSWLYRRPGAGRPLQSGRYQRMAVVSGWARRPSELDRGQLNRLLARSFPTNLLREADPKCRPMWVSWPSLLIDGRSAGSFVPAKHAILQALLQGGPTGELPFDME